MVPGLKAARAGLKRRPLDVTGRAQARVASKGQGQAVGLQRPPPWAACHGGAPDEHGTHTVPLPKPEGGLCADSHGTGGSRKAFLVFALMTLALGTDPPGGGSLVGPAGSPASTPAAAAQSLTFQVLRCDQAQSYHEGDFLREGNRKLMLIN